MCPKGRAQNRNGGKMKKKAAEKVEMKESLLKGEALALNDAELECAAGGGGMTFEERFAESLLNPKTPGLSIEDRIDTRRRRGDEIKTQPQSPEWKPIQPPAGFDDIDREESMNELKRLLNSLDQEASRFGSPFDF